MLHCTFILFFPSDLFFWVFFRVHLSGSLQQWVDAAEVTQVLAGFEPALDVCWSGAGLAGPQEAAGAHDVGQRELLTQQPRRSTQRCVESPEHSRALFTAALRQLEERGVHPSVHQCGRRSVPRLRAQQTVQEAAHVPLALDRDHALCVELHLQLRH